MMSKNVSINRLREVYHNINEAAKLLEMEPIFKITNKSSLLLSKLVIVNNAKGFENLIDSLYIIIYEGSGNKKRIPSNFDTSIIDMVKELRNHYFHDRDHGDDKDVKKKYRKVRNIYEFLIGKKYPATEDDYYNLGISITEKVTEMLQEIFINLEESYTDSKNEKDITIEEEIDSSLWIIKEYFEHKITIFPKELVNYREIKKYNEFERVAEAPIFIPSFNWISPPKFGDSKCAIYITSEASTGSIDGFKDFIYEVEKIWDSSIDGNVVPHSKIVPWSISDNGYMVYGSGADNLVNALSKYEYGCISIVLIGNYGDKGDNTFFIVIGSYWKGNFFSSTFIDIYLSSVPLEWSWVNKFNNVLDKVSKFNRKATSYTLNPYYYYIWHGEKKVVFDDGLIGGFGRSGYDRKSNLDMFEGLIVKKEKLNMDYLLDEEDGNIHEYYKKKCPINDVEEFIVSATNPIPSLEEIINNEFIGINEPRIYMLCFPGRGWSIYAINGWGWSIFQK